LRDIELNNSYDVIIAGAGPAGSVLAYELAKTGIKVLVLEKYKMPRYKCCAGGITYKTSRVLPIKIDDFAEDVITKVDVFSNGSGSYSGKSDRDLVYTISRDKFDNALADLAIVSGATLIQGKAVEKLSVTNGTIEIATARDVFHARYIVGADGANSVVSRQIGFNNRIEYITGINAEIALDSRNAEHWKGRILVDVTRVRGGYAWIFPKAGFVSAGIASVKAEAGNLRGLFNEFLAANGLGESQVLRRRGARIPLCKGNPVVASGNMALVGDAAGFADPLSGEGIYYAVLSAQLLSKTIKGCMLNGSSGLDGYQQLVIKNIMPEIRIARVLQKIFIRFPHIAVRLLNYDERAWRGCCHFARGELSYANARQLIGGYRGMKILLNGALGNKDK
jgi:geranylgeranyl reductase family protein